MGVSIQKTEERFNPRTEGWLGGFLRICKAGYMCWLGVLPGRVARPALYIATTANEDQYNPNQPTSNHEGTQPHKWTQCELSMNIEFLWPSFSSCECVIDITAFAVDIGDNIFYAWHFVCLFSDTYQEKHQQFLSLCFYWIDATNVPCMYANAWYAGLQHS